MFSFLTQNRSIKSFFFVKILDEKVSNDNEGMTVLQNQPLGLFYKAFLMYLFTCYNKLACLPFSATSNLRKKGLSLPKWGTLVLQE